MKLDPTVPRKSVTPLQSRSWWFLGVTILPFLLTVLAFTVHGTATGTGPGEYGLPVAFLVYGVANAAVLAGVYWRLTPDERAAVFRFQRPSRRELGWTAVAFPAGIGVYLAVDWVLGRLGFAMGGLGYSLADPMTLAIVAVGAVLIAPISEEVLYRGLVLGYLLSRGVSATVAVAGMALVFGLIHGPLFGVAGTVFATLWGVLPAVLRLRFDNLSGAVLLHGVNNAYAYLVVVWLNLA